MLALKTTKTIRKYIVLSALIIAGIIAFLMFTLSNLRQDAIQTHQRIASLHAQTIEEHFSQMLQNISITLDRIPLLSDEIPDKTILTPIFTDMIQNTAYLRSLSLINEEGTIIASSSPENIAHGVHLINFLPIPFADLSLLRVGVPWKGRDFYNGIESTPHMPITNGEISFLPVMKKIVFNKRTLLIVATINMDYLSNRYSTILNPAEADLFLWRVDGTLLFSTNKSFSFGLSHYTKEHPSDSEDFYAHTLKYEHTDLDIYKVAHIFPFVVEIRANEHNALGYWDKERQKVLLVTTTLVIFAGLLSLALMIRYVQENERQRQQLTYEKQFRIAMEATQTGLWTWNYVTQEITWDEQCYALLRYKPNSFEITYEKIYQLTHPDDAATNYFAIKAQIISAGHFTIERRMQSGDNQWIWVQIRGKVIEYTEENEPLLLTGVYINIDAQKKAESIHLNAVAFETQEAIMITDANEKVLKVNEAFTRITGYNESDILGKTPRVLASKRHDKAFYEHLWNELNSKGFWQGEMWNKRKDGQVYPEFVTITAIRNAKGEVTHYIANFSDITPHKQIQKEIQELAYYDPLTHLGNRRLLEDKLDALLEQPSNKTQNSALIFIDLDRFKELNDTYGHDAGDMLLVQVASRLKESVRNSDLVIRLGGDEFVIILANLGVQKTTANLLAKTICKKILSLLCKPYALTTGNYICGASIGYTLFDHVQPKDQATILKEADQAMYQAKKQGGNQIYLYE